VTPLKLLQRLADGNIHSGQDLARSFGVSRAAVWKHAAKLASWGLDVQSIPGNGYRLSRPVDLLDADLLAARVNSAYGAPIERIDVFAEIGSTNAYLAGLPAPAAGRLSACVAEFQTDGRGRRGRSWQAPFGAALCLSVGWQFAQTPPDLSALTLAAGVIVKRALRRLYGFDAALKWPNDVVWDDRKLGGILVELAAEAQGACRVIVGVGINVSMPADLLAKISDWAHGAVDLSRAAPGVRPQRTGLAAELIEGMSGLLADYESTGFAPYHAEWSAADYLAHRPVRIDGGGTDGIARGIDADGALQLQTADGVLRRVISGDVSIRPLR
jgi:BirA family biotin operon repressor/biotin-[acetyl-CoA-carboxylase] ligase